METDGGGWTRLHYKDGARTVYSASGVNYWDETMVENLNFSEVAWSDKLDTLNSEKSWILRNIDYRTNENFEFNSLKRYKNVLNGLTPTGTEWSSDYEEGYLRFRGELDTMGDWTEMFRGCEWTANLGEVIELRIGGRERHQGEFIHSVCNNYKIDKPDVVTITSLWDTDNTRVMWVR